MKLKDEDEGTHRLSAFFLIFLCHCEYLLLSPKPSMIPLILRRFTVVFLADNDVLLDESDVFQVT